MSCVVRRVHTGGIAGRGALRFVAGLTVAAAVVVALVGVFAVVQAIDDLVGAPTRWSAEAVALEGSSLDLVGARGDEVKFYLADNSVKGLWAAPRGLRLELSNDEAGFATSAQVVAPKQKDWKDPVFYSSQPGFRSGHEFEIRASLTVPDVPGPQTQTLTGRLAGEFLSPGATDNGLHFNTVSHDLDMPATLAVVSEEESERTASDFRATRWRRILIGVVFAIVAFGYPITYGMWKDGEQTRRWEPYLTLVSGVAVWFSFAALWLKPFGA